MHFLSCFAVSLPWQTENFEPPTTRTVEEDIPDRLIEYSRYDEEKDVELAYMRKRRLKMKKR